MEGGMRMIEERLLRYAAPQLYKNMVEVFSNHYIHSYDVQAYVVKKEHGMDVTLRFSSDFSQFVSAFFSSEQAENPDKEVIRFFEEAAEKCKSLLIADYYKMIKL
jgi:methylase of polypeptide subunit release factors